MIESEKNIILWDSNRPANKEKSVWLMQGYDETINHRSILKFIEKHSDTIRKEYLEWISKLSEIDIRGKKLKEHLEFEPEFSIWWMTLLNEKSIYKSQALFDCIRVLAVEKMVKINKPESIRIYSNNKIIINTIKNYCETNKIIFSYSLIIKELAFNKIINLRKILPFFIKAPISLIKYIVKRWALREVRVKEWNSRSNAIFIFSYFIHLDKKSLLSNNFYSKQWETLPKLLINKNKKINWIHHFLTSELAPNSKKGNEWLKIFNHDSDNQGIHSFLDSFLSVKIILLTFGRWIKLCFKMLFFQKFLKKSIKRNNKGWLWPIFNKEWKTSIFGSVAIENFLWIGLLDKAMKSIPKQELGLYLCENQAWEKAFIFFWKKNGHGELIGVPHSTIRYWDLRYFNKNELGENLLCEPKPDKIALNGPAAMNEYIKAEQPIDNIVEVEALRFLHLKDKVRKIKTSKNNTEKLNLLLIGDYVSSLTHLNLEMLDSLNNLILENYNIYFKAHPATNISLNNYNKIKIIETTEPLNELLPKIDIAFSTIMTSASVETFLSGIPTIITLNSDTLNFSPLRNSPGVYFINNYNELQKSLKSIRLLKTNIYLDEYYWIDSSLQRWKKLLRL